MSEEEEDEETDWGLLWPRTPAELPGGPGALKAQHVQRSGLSTWLPQLQPAPSPALASRAGGMEPQG